MEKQQIRAPKKSNDQLAHEEEGGLFLSSNSNQQTADPDDVDDRQRNQEAADQSPGVMQMKRYHSIANQGSQGAREMAPPPFQLKADPLHTPSSGSEAEGDEFESEESDAMQLMAFQDGGDSNSGEDEVIQRRPERYKSKKNEDAELKYKAKIAGIANVIDNAVQSAREEALNWRDFVSSGGYLERWYEVAKEYFDTQERPKFIHARFGYAVETLACQKLDKTINNLTISFQVSSGPTRPDIVVTDGNTTVAWMDITSDGSEEHIFKKSGSGWKNHPFIYEIFYERMKLVEIMENDDNPILDEYGKYMGSNMDLIGEAEIENEEYVRDEMFGFKDSLLFMNQKQARLATRKKINELGINVDISFKETKGILAYLALPIAAYGFKPGDSGNSGIYREWKTETSKSDTEESRNNKMAGKIEEAIAAVQHKEGHLDLVSEFLSSIRDERDYSDSKVKEAITVRQLVSEYDFLDGCKYEIRSYNYLWVIEFYKVVSAHLEEFPTTFDAGEASDWIEEADTLFREWDDIKQNLDTLPEFQKHILKLHSGNKNAITDEEEQLRKDLFAYPLVDDAEGRALRYMDSHSIPNLVNNLGINNDDTAVDDVVMDEIN